MNLGGRPRILDRTNRRGQSSPSASKEWSGFPPFPPHSFDGRLWLRRPFELFYNRACLVNTPYTRRQDSGVSSASEVQRQKPLSETKV
jgi:hypothetical protein